MTSEPPPLPETVRRMWNNGGRPLLLAVCLVVATGLLCLATLAYATLRHGEQMPVRYLIPIPIVGDATTFRAGEPVVFRRTRCNDSAHPETVASASYYRRVDLVQPAFNVPSNGDSVVTAKGNENPDGCETTRLTVTLPAELIPGLYVYEGQACLKRDTKLCTSWKTEQFSVAK